MKLVITYERVVLNDYRLVVEAGDGGGWNELGVKTIENWLNAEDDLCDLLTPHDVEYLLEAQYGLKIIKSGIKTCEVDVSNFAVYAPADVMLDGGDSDGG